MGAYRHPTNPWSNSLTQSVGSLTSYKEEIVYKITITVSDEMSKDNILKALEAVSEDADEPFDVQTEELSKGYEHE